MLRNGFFFMFVCISWCMVGEILMHCTRLEWWLCIQLCNGKGSCQSSFLLNYRSMNLIELTLTYKPRASHQTQDQSNIIAGDNEENNKISVSKLRRKCKLLLPVEISFRELIHSRRRSHNRSESINRNPNSKIFMRFRTATKFNAPAPRNAHFTRSISLQWIPMQQVGVEAGEVKHLLASLCARWDGNTCQTTAPYLHR